MSNFKSSNDSTVSPVMQCENSNLENILAELSRESQAIHYSDFERTSKYNTRIFEVLMRTILRTYLSRIDLEQTTFQLTPSSNFDTHKLPSDDEFPVTIRKTEILLLPSSWKQDRGAIMRLHKISSASFINSKFSYQTENFSESRSLDPRKSEGMLLSRKAVDNKSALVNSICAEINTSPLLLYTAFKIAFMAQQISKCV